jgi:hypothetical protein
VDSIHLHQYGVADTCEHANALFEFCKRWGISCLAEHLLATKKKALLYRANLVY